MFRWGDVELKTGSDGIQYLELQERQTKTRTGVDINDVREVTPKMFATPDDPDRCPVAMYKIYQMMRPHDFCAPDHPFYIAPRTTSQKHISNTWFMKMTLGEKKIGGMLKAMAVDGGLDKNKRLTNHSTRKHLVQKLRDSGIAPTDIMQISGHKNIQSVLNYSAMSEAKHKECSKILSNVRPRPSATATLSSNDFSYTKETPTLSATKDLCQTENKNITQNEIIVPHPPSQLLVPESSANCDSNSNSLSTDNITLNTQLNSLFSGAILNIQNFNLHMNSL